MAWYESLWEEDDCKKYTIAAAVLVGVGLVVGLACAFAIVYPPKAAVADATLLRFALATAAAPAPALSYNLTVVLSLRNPNWYRGIQYDALAAAFSFNGTRFDDSASVPAIYQRPHETATFRMVVGGAGRSVKLGAAGVAEFQRENATGQFGVELSLDTVMRYKGRKARCPLAVVCPVTLQLADQEAAATAFQRTACTVLRAKKSGC